MIATKHGTKNYLAPKSLHALELFGTPKSIPANHAVGRFNNGSKIYMM